MINLTCCSCGHSFCGSCLRQTWTMPIGRGVLHSDGRVTTDEILHCCGCGRNNPGVFWKSTRVVEKKADNSGQGNLFK